MPLRRALAFLLAASPAFAQVDTARARRDTAFLAPTTVTVVRTTMDVREAPYAIGVTTRDEIQRGKPGLALDEALAGIAGVQVDNRFNYALGERISIRGFGARAQFGVRGIRVILDGIPMTLADGQTSLNNVDVTTLNRAEVIRGPASTLHGNAAGGVIQLESAVADIDDARPLGGWVRTDAGEHGLLRQQLSIGGRRDSTSITVAGSRMFYQGFRQWNDATNDHVSLLVRRGTSLGALTVSGNWVEYNAKNPGGLDAGLLASNRDTVSPTNYNNRTGERGRQAQAGVSWNQRVAGFAMSASA